MTAKKTPFYEVGVKAGADMRELFGYWLPWEYERGHAEEHLATRTRATICDLDYMAEFRIVGSDSLAFVQSLLTNDFNSLGIGQVRYTAMCNADGLMVDDGTLWHLGDDEYVLITGAEDDYEWVVEQAANFNVEISNETSTWTTLAVQGPRSRAVVEALLGVGAVDGLRYYRFIRSSVNGFDCLLARMGYTGEMGYEFHLVPEAAEGLWNGLLEAGASDDVLPCGQAALESLRQEAGYLLVGNDHDPTVSPFEAGIGRVVRLDKGEFNGSAGLAAKRESGVDRLMVWMKLAGTDVVNTGDAVFVGAEQVGLVTSGSYSPTQKRAVAMGYLKPNYAIAGMSVEIKSGGEKLPAVISTMPLYDPGDVRTRA